MHEGRNDELVWCDTSFPHPQNTCDNVIALYTLAPELAQRYVTSGPLLPQHDSDIFFHVMVTTKSHDFSENEIHIFHCFVQQMCQNNSSCVHDYYCCSSKHCIFVHFVQHAIFRLYVGTSI